MKFNKEQDMTPVTPCKVLLVYGFQPTRDFLSRFLAQNCGDEVKIAANFEEGLRLTEKWIPDLIISQDTMLEPELSRPAGLRSRLQNTPLISICGSLFNGSETGGGVIWITHPFTVQDLLAAREVALKGEAYNSGLSK